MAVVVGFHFDVISCEPAYGMARPRPAAAAESSACGRGQAVGSDLDPRSMVVFFQSNDTQGGHKERKCAENYHK